MADLQITLPLQAMRGVQVPLMIRVMLVAAVVIPCILYLVLWISGLSLGIAIGVPLCISVAEIMCAYLLCKKVKPAIIEIRDTFVSETPVRLLGRTFSNPAVYAVSDLAAINVYVQVPGRENKYAIALMQKNGGAPVTFDAPGKAGNKYIATQLAQQLGAALKLKVNENA